MQLSLDAATIGRFSTLALRTEFGDLDVVVRPAGIEGGFTQLHERAVRDRAYGVEVLVASLEDVIASRRAAAQITGLDRYAQLADRLQRLESGRGERSGQ